MRSLASTRSRTFTCASPFLACPSALPPRTPRFVVQSPFFSTSSSATAASPPPNGSGSGSQGPLNPPPSSSEEDPPSDGRKAKEPLLVRTKNYWKRPWSHYSWQQQVLVLAALASPFYAYYKRDEDFREFADYWCENAGQEVLYAIQNHLMADKDRFVSEEELAEQEEELSIKRELEQERVDLLLARDPPKPLELASAKRIKDIVFPWDWPTVKWFLLYPWRPVESDPPPSRPSDGASSSSSAL